MDAGTHALTTCSRAMAYTLKLGFIGVMNRRRVLDADKAMSDVLQCETEFHPLYRNIAQS
jgi:hypothetical protein